jgi:E3 ubiquitin-protein ligase HECTD2
LAIFNGHVLEFEFPLALYKKLLGRPVGLDDLEEVVPDTARGLRQLLAMSAAELQSLELTFQVRGGPASPWPS